jgi:putative oxygen-independent coproporphyrinogen III oxidase
LRGIYIHIPFCSAYCLYCGFYSVKRLGLIQGFTRAVIEEAVSRRGFFETGTLSSGAATSPYTLYIGGGTPSILDPGILSRIVERIKELFKIDYFDEFTIEVNPDDITPESAQRLLEIGVGRISMGVQSFIDRDLAWMRRRHNSAEAVEAYRVLREAGFSNISLDLIFGYSLLGLEDWRENLNRIVALAPEHISAYQMSIDRGSALYKMSENGQYEMPSQERCREQYELLQEVLSAAGYEQYEISNFAKPGYNSIHNSSYWSGTPYLGLGPGAHSFTGEFIDERGRRFAQRSWNKSNLTKYISAYEGSAILGSYNIRGEELLNERELFNEKIMLGLRRVAGVDLTDLNKFFLDKVTPEIERLEEQRLIVVEGKRIKIPQKNLFISDSIIRTLFI